eukprot:5021015-Pleurochrysis_carterae.AAC.1
MQQLIDLHGEAEQGTRARRALRERVHERVRGCHGCTAVSVRASARARLRSRACASAARDQARGLISRDQEATPLLSLASPITLSLPLRRVFFLPPAPAVPLPPLGSFPLAVVSSSLPSFYAHFLSFAVRPSSLHPRVVFSLQQSSPTLAEMKQILRRL